MESKKTQYDGMPLVLHPSEVAEILTISDDYARELFRRDDFPSFIVGKRMVVRTESLFRWLSQQEKRCK